MEKVSEQTKRYDVDAVKDRLVAYREKVRDIENQLERLDRLEMKLSSSGSPTISDMPKAPTQTTDRMADTIAQKIDIEEDIKISRQELHEERRKIEGILAHLRNSNEKAVIRARYLDGESWNGVVDLLFGGKDDFLDKEESYLRRTHMIHGSALLNMAKYIEDGKV